MNALLYLIDKGRIHRFILTARLRMSMLVLFLIVLLRLTTRTTRILPTLPTIMMREKRIGTRYGTEKRLVVITNTSFFQSQKQL